MKELIGAPLKVSQDLAALDRESQMAVIESVLGDHSVCRTMLAATGRLPAPTSGISILTSGREEQPVPPEPIDADLALVGPEEGDEEPPRTGVEYVPWPPPMTPVLRALRQPLLDTEFYPAAGCITRLTFFADCWQFADGRSKGAGDTTVHQSGSLGYPLQYDVRWIEVHLTGDPEDVKRIVSSMAVTLYFGCNTPWFRSAVVAMKPIIELPNQKLKRRSAKKIVDAFVARGHEFGHYWAPVCGDKKPRRLDSTESFRVEAEFAGPVTVKRDVKIQVCLQDILYAQL